jgi:hypothetical protein
MNNVFIFHGNKPLALLKNREFLLNIMWKILILLAVNAQMCSSQQLDNDLTKRLLLSKDDSTRNIIQLFDSCFSRNDRLMTVVTEGESLPEKVLHHAHSRSTSYPVIFTRSDRLEEVKKRRLHQTSDSFLFFLDSFEQIKSFLQAVKSLPLWNPRGRFMLVASQPLLNDREFIIENVFKTLWSEKILEALLVFRFAISVQCNKDTNNCSPLSSNLRAAIYNPFKPFNIINYVTDVSDLQPMTNSLKLIFPSLSDLHGYPLRVSIFPALLSAVPVFGPSGNVERFEGCDGHTVASLVKYMNATMVLLPQRDRTLFGIRAKNGTITGASGDVAYGRADIASNSQYMKIGWVELEYTYPHDTNNLGILVMKSKRVPQFRNLFLPFPTRVWIVLICTMMLSTTCWYFIRKCGKVSAKTMTTKVSINEAFLDVFRALISGTLTRVPTSTLGRVFIITWILLGIIITNAFQSSLTSYIAVPKYLPEINTLQQLDKAGLEIFVSPAIESYLTVDKNDKIMANLWRKFKLKRHHSLTAMCLHLNEGTAELLNDYSALYYLRSKQYIRNGYPLLHRVKQNVLSIYSVYGVPRHSPLLPRFNVIISRIVEAGLQIKWNADSSHSALLNGSIFAVSRFQRADPEPLSLTHLQTAFYLLLSGMFCSALVFVMQILKHKYALFSVGC